MCPTRCSPPPLRPARTWCRCTSSRTRSSPGTSGSAPRCRYCCWCSYCWSRSDTWRSRPGGPAMHESRAFRVVRTVGLTFLLLFTVLPLYVMLSTSVKPLGDVQSDFRWIPSTITARPFVDIWSTVPLARYFANSVIVAGCASALSVTIAVFAAYAISRYTFRGREIFRMAVLSTQMFPGILFLLPLFLIYVNIGQATGIKLNGNLSGLIITYLTFSLPF